MKNSLPVEISLVNLQHKSDINEGLHEEIIITYSFIKYSIVSNYY